MDSSFHPVFFVNYPLGSLFVAFCFCDFLLPLNCFSHTGPDYCTDLLSIETSDHARLSLMLSYSWFFDIPDKRNAQEAAKLFNVKDFIGDCCKALGARIRAAVALESFDAFHENSARIIRAAVFRYEKVCKKRFWIKYKWARGESTYFHR